MTEAEAREWIRARWGVSRETLLAALADLVREECGRQNLIAASTLDHLWARHIVDSAQLLPLADKGEGAWLDIGTGAGFPGMVVSCLHDRPITLCEPRKRRADFLAEMAAKLGLSNVTIAPCKAERLTGTYGVVSARAVASMPALFAAADHVTDRKTLWLLPKGQNAREEVASARKTWHGSFHVEQSITQAESMIVVATGVVRR